MAKIIKINPSSPEKDLLDEVFFCLEKGQIAAYPTETCYGIGADAFNGDAVSRLRALKERDSGKAISLIAGNLEMAMSVFKDKSAALRTVAEKFWPGPLTVVGETNLTFAKGVTSSLNRVGVRVPSNLIAMAISNRMKSFITATSANISGERECRSADEVNALFGGKIDLIIDGGKTPHTGVSTVILVERDSCSILREGVIKQGTLEKIITLT